MMPMGWNQIRQSRVGEVGQHNNIPPLPNNQQQQHHSFGPPHMMMQNQHQFGFPHQQHMMHPQHHQMFPQQMMGNFGMQNPQMLMAPKPPEPQEPPPPSPPAPLPKEEPPPTPPAAESKWWVTEMQKLPTMHQKNALERLSCEKWFQNMNTNQQIECWQHKLQLINKQKQENDGGQPVTPKSQSIQDKLTIIAAPCVSAPPSLIPNPQQQPGDVDREIQKAREEEANIHQQVATFERQYGEWKKQFDDWKDKHKAHPNKEQFAQYENQWMNWQTQMSNQKKQYDDNLAAIRLKIKNIEQRKNNQFGARPGFQPQSLLNNNQRPRFDNSGMNVEPQFNNLNQGQRPNFNNTLNQRLQSMARADHNPARFQRPSFGENTNQDPRFSNPGGMNNNSFQPQTPQFDGLQSQNIRGQRPPRFGGNRGAQSQNIQGQRPRFGGNQGDQWQSMTNENRFRNPRGPRFRNRFPLNSDEQFYENEEFNDEHIEEEPKPVSLLPNLDQILRGQRPGFNGPRGPRFQGRGGPRNRFEGNRQRPPRPGMSELQRFRGPRPRFPGQNNRFPGPRGLRPSLDDWVDEHNFMEDDLFDEDGNFFGNDDTGQNDQRQPGQTNKSQEKGAKVENDWKVARNMVPESFGVERRAKTDNRMKTFTMHDAKKEEDDLDKSEELAAEDDYSHYDTDDYSVEKKENNNAERGLGSMLSLMRRGRGRGGSHRGRGRGGPPHHEDFSNNTSNATRGRGRGGSNRGRGGPPHHADFTKDNLNVAKPPHVLMKEEGKFNEKNLKSLTADEKFTSDSAISTSQNLDIKPSVSTSTSNAEAIMQKAKELSNLDIKNLLSAVKSLKSSTQESDVMDDIADSKNMPKSSFTTAALMPDYSDPQSSDFDEAAYNAEEEYYKKLAREIDPFSSRQKGRKNSQSEFDESAFNAREEHYNRLAREFERSAPRGRADRLEERFTEAELVAASLDPASLGLRDEDLLLQEYMLDPSLRRPTASLQDPLLDPILQDPFLERELMMREIREREAVRRQAQIARQEAELRQQLARPILQAQKIVETIDYSHGLSKTDDSLRDDWRTSGRGDFRDDRYDHERMNRDQFNQRSMLDERPWLSRSPQRDRPRSPFNQSHNVIVEEDVMHERESMERHRMSLARDRESMERKRNSMERRKDSFDQSRNSREREEERNKRERSLERLRRMERELMERERILSERERRLKSPPSKRSRDNRSRHEWKPEGGGFKRNERRSVSPVRRRFEEQRTDRERRFRSRSRSPVKSRAKDSDSGKTRDRSPPRRREFNRDSDRMGRNRDLRRSPDVRRGGEGRDRRRFTSPSGDASITRSPRGMNPPPKVMKLDPVMIRVEDLLNDPARQRRPKRIAIILRGLPGSGKTHIAKIIRDIETSKGVTPRVLGLDDYFMVENEIFEKDPDSGRIVKKKVHEYEYEAAMEPSYRDSLLKAFKKTLEDGFFSFVIVDSINDKVSYFSDFWTVAKKSVFEVYVADLSADVHVCAKRNIHKRSLTDIQELSKNWEDTPHHMIRLDVRQMLQDSEIQEVEMGDISDDEGGGDMKKEKLTIEQLAGVPQSKWELVEANERLDKLDGIKKKRLQSSQQDMADFLSVTDDYVQRNSAPGKKRVRWADIEEKSAQRRMREVGFVVGNTDWSRMLDGDTHASKALNRTKFI